MLVPVLYRDQESYRLVVKNIPPKTTWQVMIYTFATCYIGFYVSLSLLSVWRYASLSFYITLASILSLDGVKAVTGKGGQGCMNEWCGDLVDTFVPGLLLTCFDGWL